MSQLPDPNAFQEASQSSGGGLVSDLISFMSENKKWWLTPIILVRQWCNGALAVAMICQLRWWRKYGMGQGWSAATCS